jgi:hypothetical protein
MTAYLLALVFTALELGSQGQQFVAAPVRGHITVFVHWQEQGVPGHRVELLQTGASHTTDESGIVRFSVRPGNYTVRIFDLNHGGPPLWITDYPVSVKAGATVQVEAVDCLPCV